MNYRHIYHTGNFADVFKHCILVAIIEALQIKPTPFFFLDTHAGIGLYHLASKEAQTNPEFQNGIAKLRIAGTTEKSVQDYLDIVNIYNAGVGLTLYPGSPKIVRKMLRPEDRMALCELHPEDVATLSDNFHQDPQAKVHHMDGYLALKALLPPKERRGLILIDPPFESTTEFKQMNAGLIEALKRFRNGIYALWYPIKNKNMVNHFYLDIAEHELPFLKVELSLEVPPTETGLSECGMVIINPPWKLAKILRVSILPELTRTLGAHWLVQEC